MNTGTPLDLTPFGSLLRGVGLLYWLLVLVVLFLSLRSAKGWRSGLWRAAIVLVVMVGPVGAYVWSLHQKQQEARARISAAIARFEERCKSAGEKIHRTVEDVDGVVWMKWRDPISNADNFADQYKLNDPYGQDCGGEDCIVKLLRATEGLELDPQKKEPHHQGYRFVESRDPRDGKTYRYTLRLYRPFDRDPKWLKTLVDPELVTESIDKFTARYGVTWDDISTKEDRDYWIAGSSLKVVDLQTREVVAERVGYMMDRGQGSQAGFRSPWLFAVQTACPEFSHEPNDSRRGRTLNETRDFVLKVAKPHQGD